MKRQSLSTNALVHYVLHVLIWISGVLVALAVGFGMIDGVLSVRFIPVEITALAGWVVVVLTVLSVILVFFDR